MTPMPVNATSAPASSTNTATAVANTVASLSHDQIHQLQDQSQQQTNLVTIGLEVEQTLFGILKVFAPQAPQFQPTITFLTRDIPTQQATVKSLQNQTDLFNQLDDLQDQSITLSAAIQSAVALVPVLQQAGDVPAADALNNLIVTDQAAVTALQPQIAAVEIKVSTFV
jgi:hypothetical protein